MSEKKYWVVVDVQTGEPILVDGRLPVFWLLKPAQVFAAEHGLEVYGKNRDVQIVRVLLVEPPA